MSKKYNCASCLGFSIDKITMSNKNMKPLWLLEKDYVSEFIHKQNKISVKNPENYDTKMEINLAEKFKDKRLLYWAAESDSSIIIKDAKEAYGNFTNSGITKVSKDGNAIFRFRCPQVYSTIRKNEREKHTFFRHLHFVEFEEKNQSWNDQIYTKIVVCKYNYRKTMEIFNSGDCVLINALPCNYYAKDHIPNSYNLPYKDIKKMNHQELLLWFSDIIKLHYPKIYDLLKKRKIEIYQVPIITYCSNSDCNASEICLEQLMKKGFVNVNEYNGGMKEYRKYNKYD